MHIASISLPKSYWDKIVLGNHKPYLEIWCNHQGKRSNQLDYSVKLNFYRNAVLNSSHQSRQSLEKRMQTLMMWRWQIIQTNRSWALRLWRLDVKRPKERCKPVWKVFCLRNTLQSLLPPLWICHLSPANISIFGKKSHSVITCTQ